VVWWQGATTRRAHARKAEERRRRTASRLNRVCSAVNQEVMYFVQRNLNLHRVFHAEESGQLPSLGSCHSVRTLP
jgi:hypothetical protein